MTATILFYNNGATTLAAPIGSTDTTATLATGSGSLFSPGPTGSQYFCMTFTDAATGLQNEIVHVTNVTGDVVTIVRAQEGTTAQTWSIGDNARNLITAAPLESFQVSEVAEADKWTTARNLTLNGDVVAALNGVDGTANVAATATLATVNANTGSFGDGAHSSTLTINGKGLITAASQTTITPAGIGAPPTSLTISAGSGLTGGGSLAANRTLAVDFTTVAPLASPAFTGNPTAPTPPVDDNDTSIATTAYVQSSLVFTQGTLWTQGSFSVSTTYTALGLTIGAPNGYCIRLTCTTGNLGYIPGDIVYVSQANDNAGGLTFFSDSTGENIGVSIGPNIDIINKSTNTVSAITPASWSLSVYMWR